MEIGAYTFEKFHGKEGIGSTKIRISNPMKYWTDIYPEDVFENFIHGKKYDVVIFQKVYYPNYAEGLDSLKILDLCDPDWLSGWVDIIRMIEAVNAVAVSSEGLYNYLKKITDKPLYLVPDRHDVDAIPMKTDHIETAKEVIWFGYSHNVHTLRPAIKYVRDHNLRLTVVANDREAVNSQFSAKVGTQCHFEEDGEQFNFVKYSEASIKSALINSDFAILPPNTKPEGYFKSDNKDTLAMCYGLPVAKTVDDLRRFLDPQERIKELEKCKQIRAEFNTKNTVRELKEIIDEGIRNKTKSQ